jgi:hypothetical protein
MMRTVSKRALWLVPVPVVALAVVGMLTLFAATPTSAAAQHSVHGATPSAGHFTAPRQSHVRQGKNSTSTNWSGYATTGTTYSDVKGSWTQPAASCSSGQTAYSSFWVGIDGDTTNTVEQTGTDADCSSGTPQYYAWYEMYPKFPVNLSNTVRPGDSITAEVKVASGGKFTLTISDSTQHWTFTTSQTSKKAKLGSAEWIAEAPSGSGGVLPLANFGTVSFTACTANGVSISNNPNPDEIVMQSGSTVKAQPSALGSGGASFSVAWKHS